jgi:hypothetical protein
MAKKIVVAAMTIEAGTPAKPKTIAKGDSFDIDADDPENLIGRGIVTDPDAPAAETDEGPAVTRPTT